MKDVALIFRKEWMSFVGSDRSVFFMYVVLVAGWGMLLGNWLNYQVGYLPLLVACFSVIVAANFSNTAFVNERITGSLEILLTSGVSRNGILYGKLLFVAGITLVIGAGCIGLSVVLKPFAQETTMTGPGITLSLWAIYGAASFLNAAASAYLSIVLPNPRLLYLLNLLLINLVIGIQMVLSAYFPFPVIAGAGVMTAAGIVFCILAQREYNSKRIIKPVIL
jgi:ABC-type Na+ efflux pump permease subunit